jgi:hypothetical protein
MALEEQLASVKKAIAVIEEGGQQTDIEVNQNRRCVVRARLKDLYDREAKLRVAIRRRDGGSVHRVQ